MPPAHRSHPFHCNAPLPNACATSRSTHTHNADTYLRLFTHAFNTRHRPPETARRRQRRRHTRTSNNLIPENRLTVAVQPVAKTHTHQQTNYTHAHAHTSSSVTKSDALVKFSHRKRFSRRRRRRFREFRSTETHHHSTRRIHRTTRRRSRDGCHDRTALLVLRFRPGMPAMASVNMPARMSVHKMNEAAELLRAAEMNDDDGALRALFMRAHVWRHAWIV